MTHRRFDLIAFDWDGTLFDSTALITQAIQAAVQDVGGRMPSREQIEQMHHQAHEECFIAASIRSEVRIEPQT